MMLIAGVIVGAMFLMGGAYRLMENKKTGGGTRMYALITYAGLAAVVVCTMELLKPFLTFIPQEYLTLFVFAIDIAVLILGGDTNLKMAEGRRKIITSPNTGTDRIPTGRRIRKRKNKCEQIVTGDVDLLQRSTSPVTL